MRGRIVWLLLLCLAAPCWAGGPEAGDRGGLVVFLREVEPPGLDPAKSILFEQSAVIDHVYEGLVRFGDDSLDVEPALAEVWRISEDGLRYDFRLRPGVLFHDGSPVDARAVAASFLRQIDSSHPYHRQEFRARNFTLRRLSAVEILDERTVRLVLDEPDAPFLRNLATTAAKIVSPAALERGAGDIDRLDAGSGPFRIAEWNPADGLLLERFDGYWGDRPAIRRLVFRTVPEAETRLAELLSGRATCVSDLASADYKRLARVSGVKALFRPSLNTSFLIMNGHRVPFRSLLVRQAVRHAINKASLVKLSFQDLAMPAANLLPPPMLDIDRSPPQSEFDPEAARRLLAEAGYPNGFQATLLAMESARPYMPRPREAARAIKENLAAVGVKLDVVFLDMERFIAAKRAGRYDLCLMGWSSDNGDPDNFFMPFLSSESANAPVQGPFAWDGPLRDLIARARREQDAGARVELYRQIEWRLREVVPIIPLAHAEFAIAVRSELQGVSLHPTGLARFHQASFQP